MGSPFDPGRAIRIPVEEPSMPPTSTTVTPSDAAPPPQGYDGTSPFPPDGPAPARAGGERLYVTVTAVIVVRTFVAIGLAGWLLRGVSSVPPTLNQPTSTTWPLTRRKGA
ncbi:hypothetical protein ACQF36_23520 [Streptomyces sp. Marseille-Q5077]|uniref:hypothetical protein n=1 Tax=Streptomyces sp. Marseille-Q5077 TaxID=3418995 RepID=UPI003CFFF27F